MLLNPDLPTRADDVQRAVELFGTPAYIYDERTILSACRELTSMEGPGRLTVRYAMKANPSRAILQLMHLQGLGIDAGSLEEAVRAVESGIPPASILLTSQSVPRRRDLFLLEKLMGNGMIFTVCSIRQLEAVLPLVSGRAYPLYCRVHPGRGSGESPSRNTGSPYSSFGVHQTDLPALGRLITEHGVHVSGVHMHIGSGSDPWVWLETVRVGRELLENHFLEASVLNLGGGFLTARMPGEITADMCGMVQRALEELEDFEGTTGRRIGLEIEPGTRIVANAGFLATEVMDLKATGDEGCLFVLLNAGMDANARPALYGSRHPFYILDGRGNIRHSDFCCSSSAVPLAVSGRCCETGDSQTMNETGHIAPRMVSPPSPGDTFLIGGCGAYCSSMCLSGYNSYPQLREILIRENGDFVCIRNEQTIRHMTSNENGLPELSFHTKAGLPGKDSAPSDGVCSCNRPALLDMVHQ